MTRLSRSTKLTLFFTILLLVSLGLWHIIAVFDPTIPASSPLTIELDTSSWPDAALRKDLTIVAQDVLACVQRLYGKIPLETHTIVISQGSSQRVEINGSRFHIFLQDSYANRSYAKFTYELGHELGHVFVGARRSNPTIEVIATATSLQTLTELDAEWSRTPPYPQWQDYHTDFGSYRQTIEQWYLKRLPPEVQAAVQNQDWQKIDLYLCYRADDFHKDVFQRDLQHLHAIRLLSQPLNWRSFVELSNDTDPSPSEDSRFYDDLPLKCPAYITQMLPSEVCSRASVTVTKSTLSVADKDGFVCTEHSIYVCLKKRR